MITAVEMCPESGSKHQHVIHAGNWQNCVGICFDEYPSILCPAVEDSLNHSSDSGIWHKIHSTTCIGKIFINEYGTREVC